MNRNICVDSAWVAGVVRYFRKFKKDYGRDN